MTKKAILLEDIQKIRGNDRLKSEMLRAAEKGIVPTIEMPEEKKQLKTSEAEIKTKQLFTGKKNSATKKKNANK